MKASAAVSAVATDKAGGLLVADDVGNTIWRLGAALETVGALGVIGESVVDPGRVFVALADGVELRLVSDAPRRFGLRPVPDGSFESVLGCRHHTPNPERACSVA